jgi:hypothetical protein
MGRSPADPPRAKYWELIADKLSASGWSWGCSSQINSTGRALFIADAYRTLKNKDADKANLTLV